MFYLHVKSCKLLLARKKSRSLESANDAKSDEQSFFSEIHTNYVFRTP